MRPALPPARTGSVLLLPLLLLLALAAPVVRPQSSASPNEELKACLDDGFVFKRTSWNASIDFDSPANLKVEAVWSSSKRPRLDLTVVTQLSVDRMPALFNQCSTFTGPMAAAVYLPLLQADQPQGFASTEAGAGAGAGAEVGQAVSEHPGLSQANKDRVRSEVERIGRLWQEMDVLPGGCQLDLMLLWEAFDSKEAALLYPVNSLRNYARAMVKTPLMSAIDVDMMISASLAQYLEQPGVMKQLEQHALERRAIVLPAFEPHRQGPFGRDLADQAAKANKEELQLLFKAKKILQFKLKVFPRGHTPTNYTRFFSTSEPYVVPYQRMFEPWFIGHNSMVPFHDVKFRGYGLNKIAHVASLNYYNYSFMVLPHAWLVHRPHEDTAVRKKVAREASDVNKLGVKLPKSALYNKVTLLFGQVKRGMIKGTLEITLDQAVAKCYGRVSWLPPLPNLQGNPVNPSIFI